MYPKKPVDAMVISTLTSIVTYGGVQSLNFRPTYGDIYSTAEIDGPLHHVVHLGRGGVRQGRVDSEYVGLEEGKKFVSKRVLNAD